MTTIEAPRRIAPVGVERVLAELLAQVMHVDHVPVASHFFDELGADSLVMATFCARVRKRGDLPSIAMRDVYAHPTISRLAAAVAERASPLSGTERGTGGEDSPTITTTAE